MIEYVICQPVNRGQISMALKYFAFLIKLPIIGAFLVTSLFVFGMVTSGKANETTSTIGFIELFEDSDFRDRWYFSNHDFGGDGVITGWRRERAGVEMPVLKSQSDGNALVLQLAPAPEEEEKAFFGGEAQRNAAHGFGDYDVIMQAGSGPGVVSAFFTYTGPFFGDPHDEIDIEILGKDTTAMYVNVFVDGQTMPGRSIPLGFDSAKGPNLFRFSWREDHIAWYARGEEIFRVTADTTPIPQTPGKLFMSIWNVAPWQAGWAGEPDMERVTEARYYCVSYRPLGDEGPTCTDFAAGLQ